jgi:hypothetical protein
MSPPPVLGLGLALVLALGLEGTPEETVKRDGEGGSKELSRTLPKLSLIVN